MSRWGTSFGRRRSGRPADATKAERDGEAPRDESAGEAVLVEDYEGLLLLRSPSDNTLSPSDVADLARGQRSDDGTVTVIAGAGSTSVDSFWPRLSELLDSLRDSGTERVRLVVAGAGHDRGDRPATARRIADAWGIEVSAPDGSPLFVPGGSLFVPGVPVGPGTQGGWWRFAPGARPQPLGPRSPVPAWQTALSGVPAGTDGGSVVEQIPAGLLVRPAEATATRPGDLYHSVPVDPRRPAVVVGVPYGEDVAAEEVTDLLVALPESVRSAVRLVPGGRRDLLPLAQSVSDRLETEVELMTGLPLIAAGGPMGTYSVRSVLVGPDGTPQWLPFVHAVMCRPARGAERPPAPRLLRWTPPLPGSARPEEGAVGLSDQWQVMVTRAGLWVGSHGGPPLSHWAQQVNPAGPLIEVGVRGERLDLSLWPALSGLLGALAPDVRERATLHVHGVPMDGGGELRRLAARHGLRTIRFAPGGAPAPARPGLSGPTGQPGEPGRMSGPIPRGGAEHGKPHTATEPGPAAAGSPRQATDPPRPPAPGAPGVSGRGAGRESASGPVGAAGGAGSPGRAGGPVQSPGPGAPGVSELESAPGPEEAAFPRGISRRGAEGESAFRPAAAGSPGRAGGLARSPGPGAPKVSEPESALGPESEIPQGISRRSAEAARAEGSGAPRGPRQPAGPGKPVGTGPAGASGRSDTQGGTGTTAAPDLTGDGTSAAPDPAEGGAHATGADTTGAGTGADATVAPDRPDRRPRLSESSARADGTRPPESSGQAPGADSEPAPGSPRTAAAGTVPDALPETDDETDRGDRDPAAPTPVPSEGGHGAAPATASARSSVPVREPAREPAPAPKPVPDRRAAERQDIPQGMDAGPVGRARSGTDSPEAAADPELDHPSTPEQSLTPAPAPEPAPAPAPTQAPASTPAPAPAPAPDELPDTPLPPAPLEPGHRSTEGERSAFRVLADGEWDRHGAAVARSLARMPALRGKEQEAARADLIALRLYLHGGEGELGHEAVARALRAHDEGMLPYAACLTSGLNRLPSYRGVVLRGTGPGPGAGGRFPRPGALLRDPALVSVTPLDPTRPSMTTGGSYVIWSVAARRVRQLLDNGDGPEEVVFAPGTLFRVLDVRRSDSSVQVFLRELTPRLPLSPDPDADRAALARLDAAVHGRAAPAGDDQWPERCAGPIGARPV